MNLFPDTESTLTDPQLKVVERVLVDLLDALIEGDGKICQRTQVPPLIFTLLWKAEESVSLLSVVTRVT